MMLVIRNPVLYVNECVQYGKRICNSRNVVLIKHGCFNTQRRGVFYKRFKTVLLVQVNYNIITYL